MAPLPLQGKDRARYVQHHVQASELGRMRGAAQIHTLHTNTFQWPLHHLARCPFWLRTQSASFCKDQRWVTIVPLIRCDNTLAGDFRHCRQRFPVTSHTHGFFLIPRVISVSTPWSCAFVIITQVSEVKTQLWWRAGPRAVTSRLPRFLYSPHSCA